MGNALVAYLRLRSEYALVPHPLWAAALAAQEKETTAPSSPSTTSRGLSASTGTTLYGLQSLPYVPSVTEAASQTATRARRRAAAAAAAGGEPSEGDSDESNANVAVEDHASTDDSVAKALPHDGAGTRRAIGGDRHEEEGEAFPNKEAARPSATRRSGDGEVPPEELERGFGSFLFTIPGSTGQNGNAPPSSRQDGSRHHSAIRPLRKDAVGKEGSVALGEAAGGNAQTPTATTTGTAASPDHAFAHTTPLSAEQCVARSWGMLLGRNSRSGPAIATRQKARSSSVPVVQDARQPSSAHRRRRHRSVVSLRQETLTLFQAQLKTAEKRAAHAPADPKGEAGLDKDGDEGVQQQQQQQQQSTAAASTSNPSGPRSPTASLSSLSDMGPMDCADAFLYFHPEEGTYRHQESSIYRAPQAVTLTLAEMRQGYQNGHGSRLRTTEATATEECSAAGRHIHEEQLPTEQEDGNKEEDVLGMKEPPTHAAAAAARQAAGFVSLVEDLQERCTSSSLPAVAWRRAERPVTTSTATAASLSGQAAGATLPSSSSSSSSAAAAPFSRGADGRPPLFPNAGDVPINHTHTPSTATVFYMGPQQHLTYPLLWMKICAFGWGLRSLGLKAGSLVGLCADARWEWLVTVYACWTQGFVPVVFPDAQQCLAVMAAECAEMKVVVCSQSLVPEVRHHIRAAVARADEEEREVTGEPLVHEDASERTPSRTPRRMEAVNTRTSTSHREMKRSRGIPLFVALRDLVNGDRQQEQQQRQQQQQGERPVTSVSSQNRTATLSVAAPEEKRQRGPSGNGRRQDEVKEEEEAEPLWWTDVLEHGEGKLFEHRHQQLRTWKANRRRQAQQYRRSLHQQHQHPRGATDSSTSVGGATSTQLTAFTQGSESSAEGPGWAGPATSHGLTHQFQAYPPQRMSRGVYDSRSAPLIRLRDGAGGATLDVDEPLQVGSSISPSYITPLNPMLSGRHELMAGAGGTLAAPPPPLHFAPSTQVPLRATDVAMVLYTEGDVKGVMLTHGALKASVTAYTERLGQMGLLLASRRGKASPGEASEGNMKGDASSTAGLSRKPTSSLRSLSASATTATAATTATSSTTAFPDPPHAYVASLKQRSTQRPSQHRHTYVAHLPPHHLVEFLLETTLLLDGYLVCFGSRQTLLDTNVKPHGDLTEYKPQLIAGPPELLAQICRKVEATLPPTGYRRLVFDVGYEERRLALRRGLDTPYLNSTVFSQPQQLLGGRCRLVLSCGAPLHPRIQEYLQVVSGAAVTQAYAPAEAGGCGLMEGCWAGEQLLDCLGGPLGAVEVKLRDVAVSSGRNPTTTLNTGVYRHGPLSSLLVAAGAGAGGAGGRDGVWSHHGVRPSGELMLRGPTLTCGFYRQVERAAEVLEEGGWLHTGDVVERLPNGGFRLVARMPAAAARAVTNSTGHCLSPEALEAAYGSHPLCTSAPLDDVSAQTWGLRAVHAPSAFPSLCVLAHPHRPYICALVLTDEARVHAFLDHPHTRRFLRNFHPEQDPRTARSASPPLLQSWPYCLEDEAFNAAAAASMNFVAGPGLCPWERLRCVRLLPDEWSASNGLRSPTGKLQRAAIEARYARLIADMFAEEF